jgi:hypothetical protein
VAKAPSDDKIHHGPACFTDDTFFSEEVWPKVASKDCLKCHKPGGDAEDTKLVLEDPAQETDAGAALKHNRAAFEKLAAIRKNGESRLLAKASGGLDHEGKQVLEPDSTGYHILAEFVRQVTDPDHARVAQATFKELETRNFFDGVTMLDNRKLLRRTTLSLCGRLPSDQELAAVEKDGLKAMDPILDAVMDEEAFYDRLAEGFNDLLLTRGYDDGAESALAYEYFEKTRIWTQKYDLSSAGDKQAQQKARYKLTDDYNEALRREPTELIKYIVRNDRPFTEIVTADYTMVSPYTARGYGVFDEIHDKFHNPDDPFEFVPVRLGALRSRSGKTQKSETGFYPHAGLLTSFQYLRRYPTTETNRNRLRARMYFQHYLGIDVLELAPRVSDAAAITAKFDVPTMQAAECVVCHKVVDPIAGLFQDYYNLPDGLFNPRKDGWFKDMFPPGVEGEDLPSDDRWRALQWLGEHTAKDPRFAATMVEHVYYLLTGRKALRQPTAIDDPFYNAKQRAYQAQHEEVERIAKDFAAHDFILKGVFKQWIESPFYRADSHNPLPATPEGSQRQEELADLGIARLLSPEQLERKLKAVFGKPWGRLHDKETALLYGGIDSEEVTERATDPSGAMGALQRMMSDEVACKNVAADFALDAAHRRLFPSIEPDVVPGVSPDDDQRIRAAIIYLQRLILGRYDATENDPEVERTFRLFSDIIADAHTRKYEPRETYYCGGGEGPRVQDPTYAVRAWRGVVTYLLRQETFLYE